VVQITRAGGEFLRAAGEIPHHFICEKIPGVLEKGLSTKIRHGYTKLD